MESDYDLAVVYFNYVGFPRENVEGSVTMPLQKVIKIDLIIYYYNYIFIVSMVDVAYCIEG